MSEFVNSINQDISISKQIELLDNFEYRLVELGYLQLSIDLEKYEHLHPNLRWQSFYSHLQNEYLPHQLAGTFSSPQADWKKLALVLNDLG
jgi:hypothetical protein